MLQKPCPEIQPTSAAAGFTTYLVFWFHQAPELSLLSLREVTMLGTESMSHVTGDAVL